MTAGKTYLVVVEDLTVVWFNGHVISAWDGEGNSVNLWYAYAITKSAAQGEA